MEKPEAIPPCLQVRPDRLHRKTTGVPQRLPATDGSRAVLDRLILTLRIYAVKDRLQNCQQQAQKRHILCRKFARQPLIPVAV